MGDNLQPEHAVLRCLLVRGLPSHTGKEQEDSIVFCDKAPEIHCTSGFFSQEENRRKWSLEKGLGEKRGGECLWVQRQGRFL